MEEEEEEEKKIVLNKGDDLSYIDLTSKPIFDDELEIEGTVLD